MKELVWKENIIIVDAEFIDSVAFDLIVNFERMLGRRIPKADLSKWIEAVALDGGLRPGKNDTQVVFLNPKKMKELKNFTPSHFDRDIDGKAFNGNLGEFELVSYPVEDIVPVELLFWELFKVVSEAKQIKHIILAPNIAPSLSEIRDLINKMNHTDVTLLSMEPLNGFHCKVEILGYSIMHALDIGANEIPS